ncbi:glycoside hydrolase family 3 N-terminal domain-containing protein [uncultured Cohaesibacter sp.]|uniref:glycoside hydrolase family 3 N-terminal domain-containing protein n=1 Tax=uncultured Cohaesibacter sp. TaxID=1002546 RepID=UPI0029C8CD7C|nr:glycoside hydrolase family 3 N-terminal domain-containing protein [uncultured Cohaesibacter sp.]
MSMKRDISRRATLKMVAAGLAAPALIRASVVNAAELDRAIGSLIMVGFSGKSAGGSFVRTIAGHITKGRAGSVVYLSTNVGTRKDVLDLNKLFHDAGVTHIAIDHEGGTVQRLKKAQGFTRIGSALNIAQSTSPGGAEKIYEVAARELAEAGFTFNLGPVADLHRSYNPVIGQNKRAYGEDAATVIRYAGAFVKAHRRHGITTALKHFPGHGLSRADSHNGFVDIRDSWKPEELTPFAELVRQGLADVVMSGHLYVRVGKDSDGELTTFSRALVRDALRRRMGFNGLIMTDDLNMGAVRKVAAPKEATLRAASAGYDILLLSNSLKPDADLPAEAVGWIRDAVRHGQISEKQILDTATRLRRSRSA